MNQINLFLKMKPEETSTDYLLRLSSLKNSDTCNITWQDLANIFNQTFNLDYGPDTWRKRCSRLRNRVNSTSKIAYSGYQIPEEIKQAEISLEKRRIQLRDERNAYHRKIISQARYEEFLNQIADSIKRLPQRQNFEYKDTQIKDNDKVIIAMLSDIHYGMVFETVYSKYNMKIAADRITKYLCDILKTAQQNNIHTCYVPLMGDMISGNIHNTIRLENRLNVIDQTIGVSELIAWFIGVLARQFDKVIVSNVNGNHSRVDISNDDALRGQRLDKIIPWYCKNACRDLKNVQFIEDQYNGTIATINFFGKNYVSIHGDFDSDIHESINRIQNIIGDNIYCIMAGHMHVSEMKAENTIFVRNGAVCTGGDQYTAKKRLFGPAVQTFMIINKDGIESIHPVKLS